MLIDIVSFLSVFQATRLIVRKLLEKTQLKFSCCTSPSHSVLPGICPGASCMGQHGRLIFASGSCALGLWCSYKTIPSECWLPAAHSTMLAHISIPVCSLYSFMHSHCCKAFLLFLPPGCHKAILGYYHGV